MPVLLGYYASFLNLSVFLFHRTCRVLTVHGSMDKIVPVEDAFKFNEFIPNHKLFIVEGADHEFTWHQDELASIVLEFIKAGLPQDHDVPRKRDNSVQSRL